MTNKPAYYVVRSNDGGGHSRGNPDTHAFWVEHPDGFKLMGLTEKAANKLAIHLNKFIDAEVALENEIKRLDEQVWNYAERLGLPYDDHPTGK